MPLAGKPISAYRIQRAPSATAWSRRYAFEKPPLWEFVFLSMLLHAIAIALFGAPSGGSREGRAVWGALSVVLQGPSLDAGPQLKMDRAIGLERPQLKANRARPAPLAPPTRPEPAAPLLKTEPRIESIAPPVEAPPALPTPVEVPVVVPPLLDRVPTPERSYDLPAFRVPPPTPVQTAPSPPPTPAAAEIPAVVERPAPKIERAPAEEPPVPAPLVQPRVERAITQPPPVATPMVQPLPPPPVPERVVTPLERPAVPTPAVPAMPAPVESAPVEVPAVPAPPVETIAPRVSEPAARPVERAPAEAPALPSPAPAPAPAPAVAPAPTRAAPPVERAPALREEPSLRPSPFSAPAPADGLPRGIERGPSPGYDPTAAPTLDLDAAKKRAGELARSGTGQRAILAFPMPPVPEKKSKLEAALDKAHKPDCRTAYSSLGLAAVVPLIANEFGEGTCKW